MSQIKIDFIEGVSHEDDTFVGNVETQENTFCSIEIPPENSDLDPTEEGPLLDELLPSDSRQIKAIASESSNKSNKAQSRELNLLFNNLETEISSEEKIKLTIAFMEASLSQHSSPRFRDFWEARKKIIGFFRDDTLPPDFRLSQWNQTIELSKEAQRLKIILNEQSSFAAEQIDLAIQALERDILQINATIEQSPLFDFPVVAECFAKKMEYYQSVQLELQLLNAYASRVNALRKELIKTDMRVRLKNILFQKLSSAGDLIFPKRKELIKELSHRFVDDITVFIDSNFNGKQFNRPLFFLRDEIKALQGMAKNLTLNTTAFTNTRALLSQCWDKIKFEEKERKKLHAQQKSAYKHHSDQSQEKIKEFEEGLTLLTVAQAQAKYHEMIAFIKSQPLDYQEMKRMREKIDHVQKVLDEKSNNEANARVYQAEEFERKKKEKFLDLRDRILSLIETASTADNEYLSRERESFVTEIQRIPVTKQQKQELEKALKSLRDTIDDKNEKALLALPANERENIERIYQVLEEKKAKRQEIENQLKIYRKSSAASGLSIEQAMKYDELIKSERAYLEKLNEGIHEIENILSSI